MPATAVGRAHRTPGQLVVGFGAETGDADADVLTHARAKLARKGCDLLVLNEVGTDKVFGRDENEVVVLSARGAEEASTRGSKDEVARFVVERIAREEGVGAAG